MIIGVDIDGVVRNFIYEFNIAYNEAIENLKLRHPILVTSKQVPVDKKYEPKVYQMENDIYCEKGINAVFNSLAIGKVLRMGKIYTGACKFISQLKEISSEIFFITHQPNLLCIEATLDWIKLNHEDLGLASCIFAHGDDKWKYCDILIDDKPKSIELANKNGKIGICMAQEWNKNFETQYRGNYKRIVEIVKEYENKI